MGRTWSRSIALGLYCCSVLALRAPAAAQVFHNAKLDAEAKAALQQYEAARTAHIAYLDSRLVEIDRQQATLTAAAVEAVIAERDRAVTRVLGEDGRAGAPDRLRREVGGRLNDIVPGLMAICSIAPCPGGAATPGPEYAMVRTALFSLDEPRDALRLAPGELVAKEGRLLALLGGRQPGGGRTPPPSGWSLGWFCREVFPATNPERQVFIRDVLVGSEGMSAADAGKFVGIASLSCDEIAEYRLAPSFPAVKDAGMRRALLALSGYGDDTAAPADDDAAQVAVQLGRRIVEVRTAAGALKTELQGAEAIARGLKKTRDDLVTRWTTDTAATELAQAASCIATLLGDDRSTTCVGDAAGTTRERFETLFSATAFLTTLVGAGPELQRLRGEEAFEVVQYLADPAASRAAAAAQCRPGGAGAPAPGDRDAREKLVRLCLTDAVVRTVNLAERTDEIHDEVPGHIAALAVQIADADLKAANIRLRAGALAERANNLDAQRRALLAQAKSLMEVIDGDAKAAGTDPALLDRGVFRLAGTIGRERLDYQLQVVRYGFIGMREFAQRERAITAGRYAISDALLATLAASTAGGIKPEQVAGVVSALGLTAVGLAEAVK